MNPKVKVGDIRCGLRYSNTPRPRTPIPCPGEHALHLRFALRFSCDSEGAMRSLLSRRAVRRRHVWSRHSSPSELSAPPRPWNKTSVRKHGMPRAVNCARRGALTLSAGRRESPRHLKALGWSSRPPARRLFTTLRAIDTTLSRSPPSRRGKHKRLSPDAAERDYRILWLSYSDSPMVLAAKLKASNCFDYVNSTENLV